MWQALTNEPLLTIDSAKRSSVKVVLEYPAT